MNNEEIKAKTEQLFNAIIRGLENRQLNAEIQAKCVCVDARTVSKEEVGKKHVVWSKGKVEKTLVLMPNMVLIKTLGKDGKPVIDKLGHENVYDMDAAKFTKKYPKQINGHFVQDGTPMLTVSLPEELVPEEGITILPPNWGGYAGTLMKGGLIMFPFDPNLSIEANIEAIKKQGATSIDWYPNNEPDTYAPCYNNGIFKDSQLRETFNQKLPTTKR